MSYGMLEEVGETSLLLARGLGHPPVYCRSVGVSERRWGAITPSSGRPIWVFSCPGGGVR